MLYTVYTLGIQNMARTKLKADTSITFRTWSDRKDDFKKACYAERLDMADVLNALIFDFINKGKRKGGESEG